VWPRIAEMLVGSWLVLTPAVFAGTASIGLFVMRDVAAGAAVVVMALLSFWSRTAWAHYGTALLALGLGLAGYLGFPRPGPAAAQNEIAVACMLLLFAIIPNEASRPPRPWRARSTSSGP
jgi:hypothetical protein